MIFSGKWYKFLLTFSLVVLGSLAGCLGLPFAGVPRLLAADQPPGGSQFFPQTGHSISGKFLTYWQNNGGLALFGYPLTDPVNEIDPDNGQIFLTQWFERNTFQIHPEFANTPYEVELGLLGNEVTADRRSGNDVAFNRVADAHYAGGTYFTQVGHNLHGGFKDYWNSHGGLAIFGYPISEEFNEKSPTDGQTYLVQYFERNRFEYHPEFKGTPYEVELGLLGDQLIATRPGHLALNATFFSSQKSVSGMAVDSRGNVYVTDHLPELQHVQKYDSSGKLLASWGGFGTGDGQFNMPSGIAIDTQDNVYVADTFNQRIQKFDSQGHFLAKFGTFGTAHGQFGAPAAIAVDSQGNIYVADTGNQRIEKFNASGQFLTTWGSPGTAAGQFGAIHGLVLGGPGQIAVDSQNNVYASDDGNYRTEKFSGTGQFLFEIPTSFVGGFAIDAQNQLYAATLDGLKKFSPDGKLLDDFGGTNSNGITTNMKALALGKPSGTLYIAQPQAIYALPVPHS